MTPKEKTIIRSLAGNLSDEHLLNLQENFELYVNEKLSMFVPIYRHCDYATSPNHSHPAFSFIYNIQQEGYILLNGLKINNPYKNGGSICAFSPQIQHQEVLEEGFSNYIAIMIDSEYFNEELNGYNLNNEIVLKCNYYPSSENLLFLLKLLMIEHNKFKNSSQNSIENLNSLIVNQLIRIVIGENNDSLQVNSKDIIDVAISYMYQHIETKISVNDIASNVGLSTSHFSKIFKDFTNKTPVEYLTKIRIEKAKRLLKLSNLNLSEIAFDCGFSSPSYFTRSFVEEQKITPTDYRKKFYVTSNNERS